jgi:hypothetical protein
MKNRRNKLYGTMKMCIIVGLKTAFCDDQVILQICRWLHIEQEKSYILKYNLKYRKPKQT